MHMDEQRRKMVGGSKHRYHTYRDLLAHHVVVVLSRLGSARGLSHGLSTIFGGPCLRVVLVFCLICLAVTMVTSDASSPPFPYMSHRHHHPMHLHVIAIVSPCASLPSPRVLYCYCPMHLVPITLHTSSLSLCTPHHHRPVPLVAVTLLPLSPSPCVTLACASLATLVPV